MNEIKAIIRTERLGAVIHALQTIPEMPGVTVSAVRGFGRRSPQAPDQAAVFDEIALSKLETVVDDRLTPVVIDVIVREAQTGRAGDGKIFVSPVTTLVQIRDDIRLGNAD